MTAAEPSVTRGEKMKFLHVAFLWIICFLISSSVCASDGILDTTFHSPDGYMLWDGGSGYDRGRDIALQQDGKILVTGYMTNGTDNDLMVLRYDPNGTLDTGFGTNGAFIYDGGYGNDGGYAIAVQSDNKILVAGESSNGTDSDVIVLRLDTDGTLDPNFSSNGIYSYDGNNGSDSAIDLLVQSDGKSLMCGSSSNGMDNDLMVMRLNANGTNDTTFGTNGVVIYDRVNNNDFGTRLTIQNDDKILVAGNSHNGADNDILVARFDTSGILDPNFGVGGTVHYDGGDYDRGYGLGIDSQGNIIVTGLITQPDANSTDYDIAVLRFDPNGVLDPTFGNNGIFLYDGGTREECYDLLVQCDDSILIAGHSGNSLTGISDWNLVVLKVDLNGILDTTFGTEGLFAFDPTTNTEWGYGLALQPDGKIVVTGQAYNGIDDDVIVLRLENSICVSDESPGINNPIAHWPMDEGSGDIVHDIDNRHNGVLHNGSWTEGLINGALDFNGLNTYIDMGDSDLLAPDEMTFALWIRPEHMGGARYVASRAHTLDLTDYAIMYHLSGMIEFVFDENGSGLGSVFSTTRLALGEWAHVAVTREPDQAAIHINGQKEGTKPCGNRSTGEGFKLTISSRRGQTRFFNGRIDEVHLYDQVLSEEEITQLAEVPE